MPQKAPDNEVSKSNIGEKLLGYQGEEVEIMGTKNVKNLGEVYIVKSPNHDWEHGGAELWTSEDYKHIKDSQSKIRKSVEASQKNEEERIAKEEAEQKEKAEREDLLGFDDGKTPMQKGKLLSTLMKTTVRNGKSVTRKEDIINRLSEGLRPSIHTKNVNGETKEYYVFDNGDNTSSKITKVEYDFAQYLLSKKQFHPTTEKSSTVANSVFPEDSLGAKITAPKSNIPLKTGETSKSETPNAVGAKSAEFGYEETPTQNRFAENTFTEEEVANTPSLENSHKVNPDAYVDRNAQERYDSDYEGKSRLVRFKAKMGRCRY